MIRRLGNLRTSDAARLAGVLLASALTAACGGVAFPTGNTIDSGSSDGGGGAVGDGDGSATFGDGAGNDTVSWSDGSAGSALKVDFLWVIDHSPSMAKQQRYLADGMAKFVADVKATGKIDAQMAVVTVQQLVDPPSAGDGAVKQVGQFRHSAAQIYPYNAVEHHRAPCYMDGAQDPTTVSAQCRDGFDFTFSGGKNWLAPATSLLPSPDGGLSFGDGTVHFASPFADPAASNEWRCRTTAGAQFVTNANGSINAYCWRHCTSDAECQGVYQDPKMMCFAPGGDLVAAGCMRPPDTLDCPLAADTPAVLTNGYLGLFHCLANVGVSSTQQSGFEGALRSAWLALDPKGPNCPGGPGTPDCQTSQLLRPAALLVIIVVSDDDDCSVDLSLSLANGTMEEKDALKKLLPTEDWNRCQQAGDAGGGNQALNEGLCLYYKSKKPDPAAYLCPADCLPTDAGCLAEAAKNVVATAAIDKRYPEPNSFVPLFQSLKADPKMVRFVAISGDSQAASPAQKAVDRAAYFRSLRQNQSSGQAPYICRGKRGEAGFGGRYLRLVEAFGAQGTFINLCDEDALAVTLPAVVAGLVK